MNTMNTRNPNSLDYSKHNLDIIKTQAQLQSNMPGEYDADDWALGELQAIQGKKYKSGWGALIDGMMVGARANMKREKYEKLRGELQIYSDYTKAMREKIEGFEKRGQFLEQTTPYAESLYSIANSKMDEATKQQYIADLMKQYQGVNPDAGKYDIVAAPAGADFFIQVDRATGEKKMTPYSSMMTPDGWQGLQKRNLENLKLGIQKQNADAYGRSVNSNVDYHNAQIRHMPNVQAVREKEAQTAERNSQTRLEALGVKSVKEIVPKMDAAYETQEKAQRVLDDIEKYPHVFSSALYNSIDTSGNASSINLAYQNSLPKEERDAYMRINKNLTSLLLSNVESLGQRNNMTLDKWIREGNPNLNFSAENAKILVSGIKKRAVRAEALYRGFLNGPATERIGNAYDQNSSHPQPQQTLQGNGGMVSVQEPSTGKVMQLNPQEAQIAISRGGVRVS